MVCLKSRKFSLFLQAQPDFALNSLEIHKGFLRLFALNPACACEIFVIFFVFRYTLRSQLPQIDLLLIIQLVIKFLTQIGIDAL